jgi:ABC-type transporter Mla subunit MlaD
LARKSIVPLTAAFGTLSAVVFTSIRAFDESQTTINLMEQALRTTGNQLGITSEEVTKLSSALQQQSTASDEAITQAQTLFIRYGNIGGDVLPAATQAALDLSAAMGTDLQTATQQLGIALSEPAEGVGRLTEARRNRARDR